MRILIFGDSIAQGFFDSRGGWVGRLTNEYFQKAIREPEADTVTVFNLGVSADYVQNIIDRIKDETKARQRENEQILIVVSIGINDAQLKDNKVYSDEYKFQEKYEKLVDMVTKISDTISK